MSLQHLLERYWDTLNFFVAYKLPRMLDSTEVFASRGRRFIIPQLFLVSAFI